MSNFHSIGIDNKVLTLIKNLYWNQKANVKINDQLSESGSIEKGVRQGCILSPLLFNIYAENIFKEILETVNKGISVNG
jgi:Reverse transcriptase (RNA-dependent DNA polymerase).